MSKTSQFKTDCKDNIGYVAQLKQQKSKRWYYLAAQVISRFWFVLF